MTVNRRVHSRIDARVQVQFRSGSEFTACYTENISKGGIYLQIDHPPDPNAVLEVVLELPTSRRSPKKESISLRSRVVRLMSVVENSKAVHRIAVQFIEMTPQIQTKLDLLYDELLERSEGA